MMRKHGKERKLQIIKAALKRFIRHGLRKTTLDEIARDLRIGKATIYHYFTSKEDLYIEAVRWEISRLVEDISLIFQNAEKTSNEKLLTYFNYKKPEEFKFPLISELLVTLLKDEHFDYEAALLKELIDKEKVVIDNFLKIGIKEKTELKNFSGYFVFQSWGYFFSKKLNLIYSVDSEELLEEALKKSIENLPV